MAHVDWRIRGLKVTTCNCDWGCPCQFAALPTWGDCRGLTALRIDEGWFGDVPLAGLRCAALYAWPGPIHFGGGEALQVVDPTAGAAQRLALLTILRGGETEPGATIFSVFAPTLDRLHEPAFVPIDFAADLDRRTARLRIGELAEAGIAPIRNPVTGAEQRARLALPDGFEFREAELASGAIAARGPIALDWQARHAHFCRIDLGPQGPT